MAYCLQNLIGLKTGCGTVIQPSSTLFINDFPEFAGGFLYKLTGTEDASFIQTFQNQCKICEEQLVNDLVSSLRNRYKVIESVGRMHVGRDLTEQNYVAPPAAFTGYRLYSPPFREPFKLELESIGFISDGVGTIDISIYDLVTGLSLFTQTESVAVGRNTITFYDVSIPLPNVGYTTYFIACNFTGGMNIMPNDGVGTYKQPYKSNMLVNAITHNGGVTFKDSDLIPALYSLVSIEYSLRCDLSEFICKNKNLLKQAYLYLLQARLCEVFVMNDEYSRAKVINGINWKENYDRYLAKYSAEIVDASIQITPECGVCFQKNNMYQIKSVY